MAKTKISEYSAAAASNTDIGGINTSEGVMTPSDLNNAIREQMAHLKDFSDGTSGVDVLNLQDDDASASIRLQAPATVTTTTTLTLPDGAGSVGQALATDGSGTLSWTKVAEANLDVSGTGTAGQAVISDGSGAFEFSTITAYPTIVQLTSGSSYTIPAGKQALYIYAAGAGGGGASSHISNSRGSGSTGGDTTISNSTLGINITASGGTGGEQPEGFTHKYESLAGSATGTVYKGKGGQGGRPVNNNFDISPTAGLNGTLVKEYKASSLVGGEELTYSIGAGGAGGNASGQIAETGHSGWIELWIW